MPPKKAPKESIVIVIDVGAARTGAQNDPLILKKAKNIARRIVEKKIFLNKDEIAVMLMGAEKTENTLDAAHVMTLKHVQYPTWGLARAIDNLEGTNYYSNWVDGLLAALKYSQQNFFNSSGKKVFMLSDFGEDSRATNKFKVKNIAKVVAEENVKLITIGKDSLEDKPEDSLNDSEIFLKELYKQVDGQYLTFDEAEKDLRFYQQDKIRQAPWYCTLDLIDKKIPIVAYVKVSENNSKFPSWKIAKEEKDITKVTQYIDRHRRTYTADMIVKGYRYGDTIVMVSDVDMKAMQYNGGPKSLAIHSFTKRESIDMEYWSNCSTRVIVPSNEMAAKPFYSLVQAMHKRDFVAIVRKVHVGRADTVPKMVALFPCINQPDEPWCLVEVELPFAEDRRVMSAKPMGSIVKQLSPEQNEAVDELLDSLTLIDEDQQSSEYCPFLPGYVPSPAIQHRWHVLAHRALYPDEPLAPLEDYLKAVFEVPSVQERSEKHFEKITELFDLENVIPKKRGNKAQVETDEKKNAPMDVDPVTNVDKVDNSVNEAKMDTEDELFKNDELDYDTPEVDYDKLISNF